MFLSGILSEEKAFSSLSKTFDILFSLQKLPYKIKLRKRYYQNFRGVLKCRVHKVGWTTTGN